MAQEYEVIGRMKDDLKRGAELCRRLQRNAVEMAPREMTYMELNRLVRRLEESCRQMAHQRGDDEVRMGFPWVEMGHQFTKLSKAIRVRVRSGGRWIEFGAIAQVFDAHLKNIIDRVNRRTERTSLSGQLLILPPHLRHQQTSRGGVILP